MSTGWELRTCQVGGGGGLGDFTMRHACMPIPRCAVLKVQWGRAASSDLYSVLCGSHRPWTVLWTVKSQFGVTLVWVWTLESAVAWGGLVRASRFPSHTWPSHHEVVDGPRPPLRPSVSRKRCPDCLSEQVTGRGAQRKLTTRTVAIRCRVRARARPRRAARRC
jgi:hypothetical protein